MKFDAQTIKLLMTVLNIVGDAVGIGSDVYKRIRQVYKTAGMTEGDLALADDRFQRHHEDPLDAVKVAAASDKLPDFEQVTVADSDAPTYEEAPEETPPPGRRRR